MQYVLYCENLFKGSENPQQYKPGANELLVCMLYIWSAAWLAQILLGMYTCEQTKK